MITSGMVQGSMHTYTVYGLTITSAVPFTTPLFPVTSDPTVSNNLEIIASLDALWTAAEWADAEFISRADGFQLELRKCDDCYWFALMGSQEPSHKPSDPMAAQWAIDAKRVVCFATPAMRLRPSYLEYLLLEIILPKYL